MRVGGFRESVFSEFRALAEKHHAVPLSSGEPDWGPPPEIFEIVNSSLRDGRYAAPRGMPVLRKAIAEHIERFRGGSIDPDSIAVTCGAYEALISAYLTVADSGSEIVTFEPFFDVYQTNADLVGATLVPVVLHPPDAQHTTWWFDEQELRAAFSERTAAIVLNTPHNPTGKVFTRSELELIAQLAEEHDVVVITDEVYEHIVFPPAKHIRPATVAGLGNRTISIGSASKTFAVAGWRVGWMHAPAHLLRPATGVHNALTWCSPAPLQFGVAQALALPDSFFEKLSADYLRLRGRMAEILAIAGLAQTPVEGTFFSLTDISKFGFTDDREFVRFMVENAGIAAIPASGLYTPAQKEVASRLVRWSFCRLDHYMDEAQERMHLLSNALQRRSA
jgi:N-succinyldiaminopimelate aminotransferase